MVKEMILVNVLDEGTPVFQECESEIVGPNTYKVGEPAMYDPEDLVLEFLPGTIVRCEQMLMGDGKIWPVAVEAVTL